MPKIVIISGMPREIAPLVSGVGWGRRKVPGLAEVCHENEFALAASSGIGAAAARRAAEAVIADCVPRLLISAGTAGALTPEGKVGQVHCPAAIIDAGTGTAVEFPFPAAFADMPRTGVLVTASAVGDVAAKARLAQQYSAQMIDMEAAAVAAVAAKHGIPFLALKAISDEYNFPLPDLQRFVDARGRFRAGRFALHIGVRPSTWCTVSRLASNSRRACRELCVVLDRVIREQ